MAKKPQKVGIHLRPNGKGTVTVDGEDWSGRVASVVVTGGVGKAPRLTLELTDIDVEIEGPVYVDTTSIVDPDRVFRAWGKGQKCPTG